MSLEKEQALQLLRQVKSNIESIEQCKAEVEKLNKTIRYERGQAVSRAEQRSNAASKKTLAAIGEANHAARVTQEINSKREKKAAKLMIIPKLLFIVYVCLSVFTFFQLKKVDESAIISFLGGLPTIEENLAHFTDTTLVYMLTLSMYVIYILTILVYICLYAWAARIWYRRKKRYLTIFNQVPSSLFIITVAFLFISFFTRLSCVPLFQFNLWQTTILPVVLMTFISIIPAFLLFPAKLTEEENTLLRKAESEDDEIRRKQNYERQAAHKAAVDAAKKAGNEFDSSSRMQELQQQLSDAKGALEQEQQALTSFDLHKSYKNIPAVSKMIEYLEKGRVDCLKDAINMYEDQQEKKAKEPPVESPKVESPKVDERVDPMLRRHAKNYVIVCAEAFNTYDKPDLYVRRSVIIDGVNCGLAMPWAVIGLNPGFHTICVEYAESVGGNYYAGRTEVKSIRADDCTKMYSCLKNGDTRLYTNPVYDATESDRFFNKVRASKFDLMSML